MRIGVYLSCEPMIGGSYQYSQFVLDALQALRDKYDVIPLFTTCLWEDVLQRDYDFQEAHFISPQYDGFAQRMDDVRCDLIVDTAQSDLAARIETPVVGIIHDLMHRYETAFPEVSAYGQYESRDLAMKSICEYSAGVLVDSELGKQHVLESYGHFFEEKIFVQPFRVPNYLYDVLVEKKESLAKRDENKFLFYPAQFWKHKNHQNLFLAIRQLLDEGISVKLVCVGSEKNGSSLAQNLIKQLGLENNITCLGYVSNEKICDLYQRARAMIMPTFFGPTNIPPLEAMFMGCPQAVSNVYAMPDQVGDAALLFDPKSVDSIAEAIRRLWEDDSLCERLSHAGRKRSTLFSREQYNQKFAENLRQILQKLHKVNAWQQSFLKKYHAKHVYLYGAGQYSFLTAAFLSMHHVEIEGFLVTSAEENQKEFLGRPVIEYNSFECSDLDSAVVLIALSKKHQEEVLRKIDVKPAGTWFVLQDADHKNMIKAFSEPKGQSFLRNFRLTGVLPYRAG